MKKPGGSSNNRRNEERVFGARFSIFFGIFIAVGCLGWWSFLWIQKPQHAKLSNSKNRTRVHTRALSFIHKKKENKEAVFLETKSSPAREKIEASFVNLSAMLYGERDQKKAEELSAMILGLFKELKGLDKEDVSVAIREFLETDKDLYLEKYLFSSSLAVPQELLGWSKEGENDPERHPAQSYFQGEMAFCSMFCSKSFRTLLIDWLYDNNDEQAYETNWMVLTKASSTSEVYLGARNLERNWEMNCREEVLEALSILWPNVYSDKYGYVAKWKLAAEVGSGFKIIKRYHAEEFLPAVETYIVSGDVVDAGEWFRLLKDFPEEDQTASIHRMISDPTGRASLNGWGRVWGDLDYRDEFVFQTAHKYFTKELGEGGPADFFLSGFERSLKVQDCEEKRLAVLRFLEFLKSHCSKESREMIEAQQQRLEKHWGYRQ